MRKRGAITYLKSFKKKNIRSKVLLSKNVFNVKKHHRDFAKRFAK